MNTLYEEIRDWLRGLQARGVTQDEISKTSGVARSYICRIMNQPSEKLKGLSLEVFFKLFPNAIVDLGVHKTYKTGDIHHNTNSPVIQGDGNTVSAQPTEETASAFLKRIMESNDIDAETKVKIFKLS